MSNPMDNRMRDKVIADLSTVKTYIDNEWVRQDFTVNKDLYITIQDVCMGIAADINKMRRSEP